MNEPITLLTLIGLVIGVILGLLIIAVIREVVWYLRKHV